MTRVSIARCDSYEPDAVEASLSTTLGGLGGIGAFVRPGDRVLLKVNLLSRATPDRAVTTHPELVRALVREVKRAGGIPMVGDSPGGRVTPASLDRLWRDTGMRAVCDEEDASLVSFDDEWVRMPNQQGSALYASFTLARPVVDCDVLISVPKFKTHGFMMFTGAVKNLFGCIPGLEKAQYHVKVPDRDDFADMLIDLMQTCRPSLAVMDAVVGMEGDGPAGGDPRQLGALIASADCVALDVVAASIAGLDPAEVYTNKAAARRGLGPARLDDIALIGTEWRSLVPEGFELPARDLSRLLPAWLVPRMRGWLTARPVLESKAGCTRCKTCAQVCPVDAIVVDQDGPHFDRGRCIRCYCCQELCPPQVIGLRVPPLARPLAKRR